MGLYNLDLQVLETLKNLISNNEKVSVRKVSRMLGMEKSLRSVQLSIERLKENGKLFINIDGKIELIKENGILNIKTKLIPLIGDIACGGPILAQENIETYFPISENMIKGNNNYFLLRANGDSMNKIGIEDGDIILIRHNTDCSNGDIVVALIDDSATLKEFRKENGIIKLIPRSTNPANKTIIVTENLIIQGIFEKNLGKI
ncbi:repressor LexA [Candidatus Gracilibacteria bacterium]|nr:repressor LexA [Candidatus Gracilibacteria bacterium]